MIIIKIGQGSNSQDRVDNEAKIRQALQDGVNEGTLAKLVDLVRLRSGGLQDDVSIALIHV